MRKLEKKLKENSHFIWLILLILITLLSLNFYNQNRQNQITSFQKGLKNIYLHKTLKEITSPSYVISNPPHNEVMDFRMESEIVQQANESKREA